MNPKNPPPPIPPAPPKYDSDPVAYVQQHALAEYSVAFQHGYRMAMLQVARDKAIKKHKEAMDLVWLSLGGCALLAITLLVVLFLK